MTQYRQGDVFLVKCPAPKLNKDQKPEHPEEDLVLARGEVTGHKHVLPARDVQVADVGSQRFVKVINDTALQHLNAEGELTKEHDSIELKTDWYRVVRQREYDEVGKWRQVMD